MICIKISTQLLSQCINELSKGEGRKHEMTRNLHIQLILSIIPGQSCTSDKLVQSIQRRSLWHNRS